MTSENMQLKGNEYVDSKEIKSNKNGRTTHCETIVGNLFQIFMRTKVIYEYSFPKISLMSICIQVDISENKISSKSYLCFENVK